MDVPGLLKTLRPHQWSKNLFVLAALAFRWGDRAAGSRLELDDVVHALVATAAFCLASSASYAMNDVVDAERDRAHPDKRHRPVASGRVSKAQAVALSLACVLGALGLSFATGPASGTVLLVLVGYLALQVAYTSRLKHIVLVDVFCIAAGFLLRVEVGGLAVSAPLSHWIVLCTLFLALFLGFEKRRAELLALGEASGEHRSNLADYSRPILDQVVAMLAGVTLLCYTLYTVDDDTLAKFEHGERLLWTVPFVAFGVIRYMFLVGTGRGGGDPARVLLAGDVPFLVNALLWCAAAAWALL